MSDDQNMPEPMPAPTPEELREIVHKLAALVAHSNGQLATMLSNVDAYCPGCEKVHSVPIVIGVAVDRPAVDMTKHALDSVGALMPVLLGHETEQSTLFVSGDEYVPAQTGKVGKA
jgi:hypothetical protein